MILACAGTGCAPAEPPAGAGAASRGLWFGPLHLCRDTVDNANLSEDEAGMPVLRIGLKPDLKDRLRLETEARVGRPLPALLDGRTISEPVVLEPITGGEISLSGVSRRVAEAMRAAALAECAASADTPPSPGGGTASARLGQRRAIGEVAVTPLRIEEDSRCPTGVQCIQAGTVRLAVRIETRRARRQAVLTLAKPLWVDSGAWLTLCAVTPHPAPPGPVRPARYRFSFALDRAATAPAPACAGQASG